MTTIGGRQTVVAWWIFHNIINESTPEEIQGFVEQAEDDLGACNSKLVTAYEEYEWQNVN